jgi:uncharacterized hydrophobic protein (TIGR00271 family)
LIKNRSIKFAVFFRQFAHLFNLVEDKADDSTIDTSIRSGVELKGTNLWVLIFAIMIASVGLNVNSTAVIIGAMLISPLMGPIMGIGYGIGIYDSDLIRKSLRNLGLATGISLFVSTVYFLLSPLSFAQSELLSRTTPSLWDVLIAFFGGLAGIIGATRSARSNIIPGVAIATALMPPLCTAGYGLAQGNWEYFFGALYLYSINCVYIAFSAVLIIWVINPTHKKFVDEKTETRVRRSLSFIVLLTMLPSIYLAVHLVKKEVFDSKAKEFIKKELTFTETYVTSTIIDATNKVIEISVLGELITNEKIKEIQKRLIQYDLPETSLILHQAKEQHIDITALKSNIVSDLYKENLMALEEKNKQINTLESQINQDVSKKQTWLDLSNEISVQYPEIKDIYVSEAMQWSKGEGKVAENLTILNLKTTSELTPDTIYKITEWFKVRIKSDNVKVIVE